VIEAVGPNVTTRKPGDRVCAYADAFYSEKLDHAGFQTYILSNIHDTAVLPDTISFYQGATLPTAIATGAAALFETLKLPLPSEFSTNPPTSGSKSMSAGPGPILLVWGGASSVGMATIQLARLAGCTVYTTASRKHHAYLSEELGAKVVVDYRSPTVVDELVAAAQREGKEILHVVDAISTVETLANSVEVLAKFRREGAEANPKLATVQPSPENRLALLRGIEVAMVRGDVLWHSRRDLALWLYRDGTLAKWLESGEFKPSPYRVVKGGAAGVQEAIDIVAEGVSGEKVVIEW
jgi:NADPH:quinone reductase-like Zn-dependent oxidoreductase